MNAEQRAALIRVRDRMASLPPSDHFNMATWKCETSACAIGTCIEAGDLPGLLLTDYRDHSLLRGGYKEVQYGSDYGFLAVAEYFGIEFHEAEYLFSGSAVANLQTGLLYDYPQYVTPLDMSAHITHWLDQLPPEGAAT